MLLLGPIYHRHGYPALNFVKCFCLGNTPSCLCKLMNWSLHDPDLVSNVQQICPMCAMNNPIQERKLNSPTNNRHTNEHTQKKKKKKATTKNKKQRQALTQAYHDHSKQPLPWHLKSVNDLFLNFCQCSPQRSTPTELFSVNLALHCQSQLSIAVTYPAEPWWHGVPRQAQRRGPAWSGSLQTDCSPAPCSCPACRRVPSARPPPPSGHPCTDAGTGHTDISFKHSNPTGCCLAQELSSLSLFLVQHPLCYSPVSCGGLLYPGSPVLLSFICVLVCEWYRKTWM